MFRDAHSSPVRRVVLVVLDGLRSDAVSTFDLFHFEQLAARGASTYAGRTVTPSVTACAMASLLTGAAPERHGLQSERFHLPRATGPLHPLPKVLAEHAMPSAAFLTGMPLFMGGLAGRIGGVLGFGTSRCFGRGAVEVLASAKRTLEQQQRGLIMMHWPDADRAGHSHGWMSPEYGAAAQRMDDALGRLTRIVDLNDPSTLLVAMADHGGGGTVRTHHNSEHPLDTTIPVVLAGGAVRQGSLGPDVRLTDVPATILWTLGIPQPASYVGTPLAHAFSALRVAA